jgi:DNA-damage-inducible protein J
MDSDVKQAAQQIFKDLGMDMTTAINVFLRQAIRYQGLPFEVRRDNPNAETLDAIREIREMRKNHDHKTYDSFASLVADEGIEYEP